MRPSCLLFLALMLTGCATTRPEAQAEARGYERGYRVAVREQYCIIQNQQRQPSAPTSTPTPP